MQPLKQSVEASLDAYQAFSNNNGIKVGQQVNKLHKSHADTVKSKLFR